MSQNATILPQFNDAEAAVKPALTMLQPCYVLHKRLE